MSVKKSLPEIAMNKPITEQGREIAEHYAKEFRKDINEGKATCYEWYLALAFQCGVEQGKREERQRRQTKAK